MAPEKPRETDAPTSRELLEQRRLLLAEARRDAERLLEEAQRTAAYLIQIAHEDAEEIVRSALAHGRQVLGEAEEKAAVLEQLLLDSLRQLPERTESDVGQARVAGYTASEAVSSGQSEAWVLEASERAAAPPTLTAASSLAKIERASAPADAGLAAQSRTAHGSSSPASEAPAAAGEGRSGAGPAAADEAPAAADEGQGVPGPAATGEAPVAASAGQTVPNAGAAGESQGGHDLAATGEALGGPGAAPASAEVALGELLLLNEVRVVVGPFSAFSVVAEFRRALSALPGIYDVRVRRFHQGYLHLSLRYEGNVPITERLTQVGPWRCQVRIISRDLIELDLVAAPHTSTG